MYELGDNADLLVKPDQWLENHDRDLASRISVMLEELENVRKARTFKRELQQRNQVAVLLTERDQEGNVCDIAIKVMPVPDAIALLSRPKDSTDNANRNAQYYVWAKDGYDLHASSQLRQTS